ncbi:MAG: carboxylating nicotinate-nucleotide diphosphorylase [Thermoguttaceae bacterium]|nr:carboxylating nicotinate-nucleotide diphosphorylase [Thermoguttaceae bacterium]
MTLTGGSRRDFHQHTELSAHLKDETRRLLELAVWEDNDRRGDITSAALVHGSASGRAHVTARQTGVVAGGLLAPLVLEAIDPRLVWEQLCADGAKVDPGGTIGVLTGPVREMLTAERLLLNLMGRLCGIATLTARYVEAVRGTGAQIYDTRKTTLGWRYLEKYAVHCGGARNHRSGLYDAILIKDNHLAFTGETGLTPADAVLRAKEYIRRFADASGNLPLVEVEVDSLDQLKNVLTAAPDIVLLDNMPPEMMREAVEIRRAAGSNAQLEASGGISLETVRAAALSGVDRVSVGALTHSAISLDIGLDWN